MYVQREVSGSHLTPSQTPGHLLIE